MLRTVNGPSKMTSTASAVSSSLMVLRTDLLVVMYTRLCTRGYIKTTGGYVMTGSGLESCATTLGRDLGLEFPCSIKEFLI